MDSEVSRNAIDFSPSTRSEALRLLSPQQSRANSSAGSVRRPVDPNAAAQEGRWGGREALSFNAMENINAPTQSNTSTFVSTRSPPPRTFLRKQTLPGEIPWRAFRHASTMLLLLWGGTTIWSFFRIFVGGWRTNKKPEPDMGFHEGDPAPTWLSAGCGGMTLPPLLHAASARRLQILRPLTALPTEDVGPSWRRSTASPSSSWSGVPGPSSIVDRGCGLHRGVADAMSLACQQPGDLVAGRCLVALLWRGGRSISICHAARQGNSTLGLVPVSSWRTLPGLPLLRGIAAGWEPAELAPRLHDDVPATDGTLASERPASAHRPASQLRIFALTDGGTVLRLRQQPRSDEGWPYASMRLVPEFELQADPVGALHGPGSMRLLLVGTSTLVVVKAHEGAGDADYPLHSAYPLQGVCPSSGTCPAVVPARRRQAPAKEAGAGVELHAWDLLTGAFTARRLLGNLTGEVDANDDGDVLRSWRAFCSTTRGGR